jgi:hypothetical protein
MDDKTTVINPAAGPDTPSLELLINPTITPPIMPEISPLNGMGGIPFTEVEARPIPKQSGRATKNTTILAGRSLRQELKIFFTLL